MDARGVGERVVTANGDQYVDFERIEGKSSDWILNHVRAGKEVFRSEVEASGFAFEKELKMFSENYFLVFRKPAD